MFNLEININGDASETILGQLSTAKQAVITAQTAMAATLPHGRNYQTIENGMAVCQADRLAHAQFMQQLGTMVRHLEDTQLSILNNSVT